MSSKGSITYVIGSTEIGGAEMHLLRISKGLVEKGWEITLFCLSSPGPLSPQFEKAGITLIHPPKRLCSSGIIGKAARLLQISLLSLHLGAHLLFKRPDIVHFFLPASYLIGAPLAVMAFSPIRLMSRRSLNVYQQKRPFIAKIEHLLHKTMTGILGNSRSVINDLKNDENVPNRKLGLLYNGIEIHHPPNPEARISLREALKISDSSLVFILVANLIPYKGHLDLLQAFHHIKDQLPRQWDVLFVGYDTGYGATLSEQVKELSLSKHVHFLGQRQDIPDLLSCGDIGLLCSHEEGFSNAVLEAMNAGLPLVVTDVGGNKEVVKDGFSGLIVPAQNPEKLAQALLKVSKDPEEMTAMGKRGQEIIQNNFSLETCVSNYDEMYKTLINNGSLINCTNVNIVN